MLGALVEGVLLCEAVITMVEELNEMLEKSFQKKKLIKMQCIECYDPFGSPRR